MKEFILDGLIPLLGMLMSFTMVAVIVIVVARSRQRRMEMQTEIQSKLIDKFGSTGELASFLQSDVGRQFVTGVQSTGQRHVHDRSLSAVRVGIVFTALGIGFLALWPMTNNRGLAWPGVLLFVLGAAYLGSAYSMMRFAGLRSQPPASLPPPSAPTDGA